MVVFTLSLVRHGETGANKENVIQGQLDVPLSETGLKQANLLGSRLQNQCYTHIFSSDLLRAKQTLQMIIDKNHHIKCSVVQDPKLRERKFGELEGKTIHELKKLARRANQSVPNFTPVGAETVQQVHQRALLFFQELCQLLLKAGSCVEGSHDKDARSEIAHILPVGIKRRRNSSVCNEETDPAMLCDDKNPSVEVNKQFEILHQLKSGKSGEFSLVATSSMEDENPSEGYNAYPVIDKSCKPLKDSPKPTTMEQLCVYVPSRCKHRRHKPNENSEHLASVEHTTSPSSLHLSKSFLPPKCNYSCANFMDSDCPNVSLLPLLEQRLSRISSADSDRKASIDSTNDDYDSVLSPIANVLVVSHGGLLREMIRHFVENLGCCLPGGKGQALRLSPNTGLSKFTVSVTDLNEKPKIICLLIHDKDHLTENGIHSLNSSIL